MWVFLAFLSAALLGLYDVSKKTALKDNAVLPVLLLTIAVSTLLFLPFIISSQFSLGWFDGTMFDIPKGTLHDHWLVLIKSVIVLASWIFGYFGIKHIPLSIYGPISATRPVIVLLGAMLLFGEKLNAMQWIGVIIAIVSIYLLSISSKKEGIDFGKNHWIVFAALATILGAASGLYDKFIMQRVDRIFVQSWFNLYMTLMMLVIVSLLWYPKRKETTPLHWSWGIPLISLFVSLADFSYFYSLTFEGSMISIISMIRRGSVIVSFACAALLFHEKNLKAKVFDLILILIGMLFLYFGSR